MKVLGISGSLRSDSHNRALLRAAASELPPGTELAEWDRLGEIPIYNEEIDIEPAPEPVADLRRAIRSADAVLIATPEYNSSIPGGLKNALDWASRPFPGNALTAKPAAVIGASTGLFGAVWSQAETRKVLEASGADVVEKELAVGTAEDAFDQDGKLVDVAQVAVIKEILAELTEKAGEPALQAA